jgi:hypothetical protein
MPELAAPIIAGQYVSLYRQLLTPAIANQDSALSSPTSIERHSL